MTRKQDASGLESFIRKRQTAAAAQPDHFIRTSCYSQLLVCYSQLSDYSHRRASRRVFKAKILPVVSSLRAVESPRETPLTALLSSRAMDGSKIRTSYQGLGLKTKNMAKSSTNPREMPMLRTTFASMPCRMVTDVEPKQIQRYRSPLPMLPVWIMNHG